MTTNQTIDGVLVSRELLDRCTRVVRKPRDETVRRRALSELRALLDAPPAFSVDQCGVQMVDCPECTHQWDHFFECGNKAAAQPQDDQARRAELLESLAKQVYQSWESQPGFVPWVDGGNSTKQDEARQIASRTFELALANKVD